MTTKMNCGCKPIYGNRTARSLGDHYTKHLCHMTGEGLHSKSDIAVELAHRDEQIEQLTSENDVLRHAELSADDTILELKNRIKLLEEYADHKSECVRATIHRAYFSDKNPCDCGFDVQVGLELKHVPHGERVKNNPFKN